MLTSQDMAEMHHERQPGHGRDRVAIPSSAYVQARIDSADTAAEQRSLKLIADLLNAAKSLPVFTDRSAIGNPTKAVLDKVRAAGWVVETNYGQLDSSVVFKPA